MRRIDLSADGPGQHEAAAGEAHGEEKSGQTPEGQRAEREHKNRPGEKETAREHGVGQLAELEDAIREVAREGRGEKEREGDGGSVGGRARVAEGVDVAEKGHTPEHEIAHGRVQEEEREEGRPGVSVPQHLEHAPHDLGKPRHGRALLDVPARMIAHEDKAEERAQQGDGADGDEGAAPTRRRHQGGEGRRPEEGAQHAHGGADGRHRPEVRGREPARRDLEAAERAQPHDGRARRHDAPDSQAIDEETGRDHEAGIGVEVHGGEQPDDGAAGLEGLHDLLGHHAGRHPMNEGEDEDEGGNAPHDPAEAGDHRPQDSRGR